MTFRRYGQKNRRWWGFIDAKVYLRDVLGVTFVERADELVMSCPLPFGLHRYGDRNPSAALNKNSLLFNCYVCGGGDIVWLTQVVCGIDYEQAISRLMSLSDDVGPFLDRLRSSFSSPEPVQPQIPSYSAQILSPWLRDEVPYLTERGVSVDVQRSMSLGLNERYRELIDGKWVERPRVIIPHFWQGRLVGWQARRCADGGPKYLSSPGFPRSVTLYNWDNLDRSRPVVVVESPMTVLVMLSRGLTNAVATFGAAVSDEQVGLLGDVDEVVLWFDADYAGQHALVSVARSLERRTKVWVVQMMGYADGKDPADLSVEEFWSVYESRMPSFLMKGSDGRVVREANRRARVGGR